VDPVLWWREDMRAALWVRDIARVYRLILDETGMSQHRLANLVGQAQSEVSEILTGRRVKDIALLERIANRLGVPRELMSLSAYGPGGTYCGEDRDADPQEGVDEDMLRRYALVLGGAAAFGAPIQWLGELTELTEPAPAPLPGRLSQVHVVQVRDLTRRLREAGNAYGSDPRVSSAAAEQATKLLAVPGPEPVKQALLVAVAGLHAEGGWAGFDAGRYDRAMYHTSRALELATEAGDPYYQTVALNYAGLATIEHGHPNDGLKMLQCGQVTAWRIPLDLDRSTVAICVGSRVALEACGYADSATALLALGQAEAAYQAQGKARELWQPTRSDPAGDLDIVAARLELDRGRLDVAEQFTTASLRRWEGGSERARTQSGIVLATIHVRVGEADGLALAHGAIKAVSRLSSVRARRRLEPLIAALQARPGSDAKELARMARQVAATRA
jgi:transcriptional regulator with XRE-family HTH domain